MVHWPLSQSWMPKRLGGGGGGLGDEGGGLGDAGDGGVTGILAVMFAGPD